MKKITLTILTILFCSLQTTFAMENEIETTADGSFTIYQNDSKKLFLKYNNGSLIHEDLDLVSATSESAPFRLRAVEATFLSNTKIIVQYKYKPSFEGDGIIYDIKLGGGYPVISLIQAGYVDYASYLESY